MKKIFSILLFLFSGMMTINAQITVENVKGDVDNDGHLSIADVSQLVNNLKTGKRQFVGQGSAMVVNDSIQGSWTTRSLDCITFNADGTTTYGEDLTYQYRPFQGRVVFYDAASKAVDSLDVLYKTDSYLILSQESNPTYTYYYKGSPVSGITLSQTTGEGIVGQTCQLTATLQPSEVAFGGVTWSSDNTDVATVSSAGLVTFASSGEVTITATAKDGSGVSSSCVFTVRRLVKSITLSDTSLTLLNGDTYSLSATVSPDNADDTSVTWSSSDETVARVSSKGKIVTKQLGETTVTCTANDGSGVSASCEVTVVQPITSMVLTSPVDTVFFGSPVTMSVSTTPAENVYNSFTWTSSDESIATVSSTGVVTVKAGGNVTITATANDGSGVKATCTVMSIGPDANGHAYVDLGLTSGTLWATMNVGATTAEGYGDYFAWGETTPQSSNTYTWASYSLCNGSYNTQTKYCTSSSYGTVDNQTELLPADDAAHVNWGGDWVMPSYTQLKELKTECTWTWTTQNSVKGYQVTGPNGNSIFLPAAGYRGYSSLDNAGSGGYYWSRTLYSSNSGTAWKLDFNSSDVGTNNNGRYLGRSVRPVLGSVSE